MTKNQADIYASLENQSVDRDPWEKITSYQKESDANLLALIKLVPHKRILEIGCAQGNLTRELAKIADEVVAIDVSHSEIKRAKENNAADNITYLVSSLEEYEAKEKFDVIICSEILYYILDRKKALSALERLGRYLVTSHFFLYFPAVCLDSVKYEWALRKYPVIKKKWEVSLRMKLLVLKAVRKLDQLAAVVPMGSLSILCEAI